MWEVYETGSGSCPVAGFGISGVESLGSAARVLDSFKQNRASATSKLHSFFMSVEINVFTMDSA
jgi:hypothetical protein